MANAPSQAAQTESESKPDEAGGRDQQPQILGLGYAVPPNLRGNDDPIFDWLKAHMPPGGSPFQGCNTRVVPAPRKT